MSIVRGLRREWKTYLSDRLWILGLLLLILCGLALVQYRWIGQVTEAERQRAKTNLTTALSGVETGLDIEITRAFAVFQFPLASPADYAERYREWLQHAPYPELIRGVYLADAGGGDAVPKGVIPGEPTMRSAEWKRDLAQVPFSGVALSAAGSAAGLQTLVLGQMGTSIRVSNPEVTIDGNPAFVFPVMPSPPDPASQLVTRTRVGAPFAQGRELQEVHVGAPFMASEWALVVLNREYIRTSMLPRMLKLYMPNAALSDYEILVVSKGVAEPSHFIFHSDATPVANRFLHPDGRINLFQIRLDCFSQSPSVNAIAFTGGGLGEDARSEIYARTPPACGSPDLSSTDPAAGRWEMLVKYRGGSLDQAMATFRQRNLLLSGSVLLVLALGMSMLVVLTERARALAEMQAEFVLGVSHELRTPLTVIRLAGDNLKKGMVESSEHVRKYGEIIQTQASELSSMIEGTLTFARLQAAPPIEEPTAVAVEEIVRAVLAEYEPALRAAGIEGELDLAAELPRIQADVRLLKGCIENLIQNVIKYAAVGRWMAIRAREVDGPEGEGVEVSIEDRGPGIFAADLPRVFEPFYRGRAAEASQVQGVGLGLTLVKRVVEAHRGTIEVTSQPTGTQFLIYLPSRTDRPRA